LTTPSSSALGTDLPALHNSAAKSSIGQQNLPPEDEAISEQAAARFLGRFSLDNQTVDGALLPRFATCIAADHVSALYPDIDTPFSDATDVVNRLLPYHVFQQPKEDLYFPGHNRKRRGKRKQVSADLLDEIEGKVFCLCLTT
jgi:hypothetical protein